MVHADFNGIENLLARQQSLWPDSNNFVWNDLISQFVARNHKGQKTYFGFFTPHITIDNDNDDYDDEPDEHKNQMDIDSFVSPTTNGRYNVQLPVPFHSIASKLVQSK